MYRERFCAEIKRGYTDAYHHSALAEPLGQRIALGSQEHFAVLCANGHRLVYRPLFVWDADAFSELYSCQ